MSYKSFCCWIYSYTVVFPSLLPVVTVGGSLLLLLGMSSRLYPLFSLGGYGEKTWIMANAGCSVLPLGPSWGFSGKKGLAVADQGSQIGKVGVGQSLVLTSLPEGRGTQQEWRLMADAFFLPLGPCRYLVSKVSIISPNTTTHWEPTIQIHMLTGDISHSEHRDEMTLWWGEEKVNALKVPTKKVSSECETLRMSSDREKLWLQEGNVNAHVRRRKATFTG